MIENAKRFALVSLLTVLIWMMAESESLRAEALALEVAIRPSAETGRLVQVEPDQDFNGTVRVSIEGPTAKLGVLREQLRRQIQLTPGMAGVPAELGRQAIDLRAALRGLPEIRDSGVVITEVRPDRVNVVVDELVSVNARVVVHVPDGEVDGVPEANPPTVRLRMPGRLAAEIGPEPEVVASVDPAVLGGLPEGRASRIGNVRVELPEGVRGREGVSLSPMQVEVTLALRSRTEATVIPSVPVHLRIAPVEYNKWIIDLAEEDRVLRDVQVSGPRELIQQIEQRRLSVVAVVAPTFEELERAAASETALVKEVTFVDVPSLLRFGEGRRTVRLVVRRRPAGEEEHAREGGGPPN